MSSRFNFTFTSRKRVKGFYFSQKKWKLIVFHSFFSRKKSQSGAGSNLTSIFVAKIVKSQVIISLKILAKLQFLNLDQTLCSMSEPNFSLRNVTKNSALISCPNFSFYTKLRLIRSSSIATLTTVAKSTFLKFLKTVSEKHFTFTSPVFLRCVARIKKTYWHTVQKLG